MSAHITIENIEDFRGALSIRSGDLPEDVWSIFDRTLFEGASNAKIVAIEKLISTKNELQDPSFQGGEKQDPRQTAYERMCSARAGKLSRRAPLMVRDDLNGTFIVLDGNATVQVLMLAGWKQIPVVVN